MNKKKMFLNLPTTTFSMKANLIKKEPETLKYWKKTNLYKEINTPSKKIKKYFFLHDGPPYANGKIHIGHAVNKILKDIILKSKRMSGFYAPFIPCWDCHGLPIEQKIEKKIVHSKKTNKEYFYKICFNYTKKQIKQQKKDFIRLGILADWNNSSCTMDYINEANTLKTLANIFQKGYIFKDDKPIYWCLECRSALAEAEIDYNFKKTPAIYVTYTMLNPKKFLQKINILPNKLIFKNNNKISIIIFTTTPWTLPSSQAIAININFNYQLIQTKKKYYICNVKLTKAVMKKNKIEKWTIISIFSGKKLKNLITLHPFFNIEIPIITSDNITETLGTGIVHMSPDHGLEDFIDCKKHNIHPINIVDSKGYYKLINYPALHKKHIFNKENIVIHLLKKNNNLLYKENIKHSYPYCWRHKKPIIFRAAPQWFIKTSEKNWLKKLSKKIENTSWLPIWGKEKMKTMLKNRPDWCISRQRTWGVPIPFFIHKKTGNLHPNTYLILQKIIKKVKKFGSSIWWKLNKKDILKKEDVHLYKKVTDTLDVWFESGSNHQLNIYKYNVPNKKNNVADLYLEGSDQHRGWFMSSLIISMITKKQVPYHTVITHGFVVDKEGKKMSKSLNNNITPQDIIKIWGADILRLWVAYTNYATEISISNTVFKQISDHYRRIRNTIRFLFSNIFDFHLSKNQVHYKKMLFIDQWILKKTYQTQKLIIQDYDAYNFHDAVQKIIYFCSIELGSRYLDIIKDRQYTMNKNSIARRSSQTTIYYILQSLVRWIAPILSFTAEEIWKQLTNNSEKFIFFSKWFKKIKYISSDKKFTNFFWKKIFLIRYEVNKIIEKEKKRKKIKNSLEIAITLYVKNQLLKILSPICLELKFIFAVSQVKLSNYRLAPQLAKKSECPIPIKVLINKIQGIKCQRCWHYIENHWSSNDLEYICKRCLNNIDGKEENRLFV
ncbi:isoleucine--tRNA ligase [Buchnera aphidicola]|uniref:isoleucine--tRNA ligase n=1 Tax=Buchnera aphidicola TaxID=9 RepID=UPI00094C8B98|nr:isoleucine--tRNA ligase [Buchnera aphidicola]